MDNRLAEPEDGAGPVGSAESPASAAGVASASGGAEADGIARLEAEIAQLRAELAAGSLPRPDDNAASESAGVENEEEEPWKPRPEDTLAGTSWSMSTPALISWVVFTLVGAALFALSVMLPASVPEVLIGAARFSGVAAMLIGGISLSFGAISRLLASD